MKALIIGVDASLGKSLWDQLPENDYHYGTSRRLSVINKAKNIFHCDLREPHTLITKLGEQGVKPDIVYMIAAITKLGDCDAHPEEGWIVNADAPIAFMQSFNRNPIFRKDERTPHFVFVSSDAVARAPNMLYSRAKAHAELYVLACGGAVVRPGRITDAGRPSLVQLLLEVGFNFRTGLYKWNGETT